MKLLTDYRFARVLCVVAHMDDESLFFGGTLRRLVEQDCEVHVVVATSAAESNCPRGEFDLEEELRRQRCRMVAFGMACGMIGVARTHLFDLPNDGGIEKIIAKLRTIVDAHPPSVILTHGDEGAYRHEQHAAVGVVVGLYNACPVWHSDAAGVPVQIDLPFKRRLLDCYRRGTTQDPYWSPYKAVPETSPLGPWLGAEERFRLRGDSR